MGQEVPSHMGSTPCTGPVGFPPSRPLHMLSLFPGSPFSQISAELTHFSVAPEPALLFF